MFEYKSCIMLKDTDATGNVYFTALQQHALESFEVFLLSREVNLASLIRSSSFLMPIVHVEADYLSPVSVGEYIIVNLSVFKVGTSSFTMKYEISKEEDKDMPICTILITHVVVDKKSKKSTALPQEILNIFLG